MALSCYIPVVLAGLLSVSAPVTAGEEYPTVWIGTVLYTNHFGVDFDYNEDNDLISLDYFYKPDKYVGVINFNNSFGDDTSGIYWGVRKNFNGTKITYGVRLGVTHGYRNRYKEHRMRNPFTTDNRLTPLITPSIGYMFTDNVEMETVLFGNAIGVGIKYGFE